MVAKKQQLCCDALSTVPLAEGWSITGIATSVWGAAAEQEIASETTRITHFGLGALLLGEQTRIVVRRSVLRSSRHL